MIRAHFFALLVLLGGVSGLGLSRTQLRMPDDSKRPAYDRVEPHFEQLKALHRTPSSINGTFDFAEFANAARMFSSAMTNELGIPIQHFVVISQARSGGAWLRSLLVSHPNVIMAAELFLDHEGTLESAYHQLEEKARGRRIMAIGFKLLDSQISHIHGPPIDVSEEKVIFYWRRNVMRQIISERAMQETHVAHVHDGVAANNLSAYKPVIDTHTVGHIISDRLSSRCEVMQQFAGSCPPFHYEDLLGASFDKEMSRLEACIGAPEAGVSSSQVAIHESSPVLSTVANPADVQSWLSQSEYAYMLNDTRLSETDRIEASICK